ncbi:alpha/beta hydrolase [Saccharothrix violaceirubra]|uniref:Pimeloyl-ACP methyl ester carboxylesterase n=1 Tax=Saccharothrix violaceirubra TaxID=413306 RepID=A0A7W7SZS2_9PSEU|nr:alpha/beta fold hydrolase [Saccharothrix violaceirubra]MBB4963929.1 pimeloyl-ACP methyl ester carboxylesterase [Saccharothrix violaceirubra]
MRSVIRALGGLTAVTALVVGTAVTATAAPESRPAAVEWAACPETTEVECGTLRLPIDWNSPRGAKFDLAVARRKAADPAKRIGVLLINPGGPGVSGVNFAFDAAWWFGPDVLDRFDIIGFDPRGVARSSGVTCDPALLAARPGRPTTAAEFDALGRYNRRLAADCRARTGPLYDHLDTSAVIDDMDALRKSLGEKKINFWGASFGTSLGQQYAERYGDKVRAMSLDSVMDRSLTTSRFNETQAAAAEDSFGEFVKWCDRDERCALHGQDVRKYWSGLLAKADRGEVVDPREPTRRITAAELVHFAFDMLYYPDWAPLAEQMISLELTRPQPVPVAFQPAFCQDWQFRVRSYPEYAALVRRANQVAPSLRGGMLGLYAISGCVGLPDATNPQRRVDLSDSPKILLSNSLHDPSTSYEWAVGANRQNRNKTVLLTYEGWGHVTYYHSTCMSGASDKYLVDLTLPAAGTRCAAVDPTVFAAKASTTARLSRG